MENGLEKLNITPKMTLEQLKECKKLLLHCCCAPCATAVIERILPVIKPTLYYFNPNTYPLNEYNKRLNELYKLAEIYSLEVIAEPYDDALFYNAVTGLENEKEGGSRCEKCIELRLEYTAKYAKENGYDGFTTTLSVSPHKNADFINRAGRKLSTSGCAYIDADFKKADGFLISTKLAKQYGLYRQNYCGCEFSRRGGEL